MQKKGEEDKMSKINSCPSDDSSAIFLQLTHIILFYCRSIKLCHNLHTFKNHGLRDAS